MWLHVVWIYFWKHYLMNSTEQSSYGKVMQNKQKQTPVKTVLFTSEGQFRDEQAQTNV